MSRPYSVHSTKNGKYKSHKLFACVSQVYPTFSLIEPSMLCSLLEIGLSMSSVFELVVGQAARTPSAGALDAVLNEHILRHKKSGKGRKSRV